MRAALLLLVLGSALILLMRWGDQARAADAPVGPGYLGREVVVYLRADATGLTFPNRVVDLASLIQRKGKATALNQDWLVLSDKDREQYIPKSMIVLVEAVKAP